MSAAGRRALPWGVAAIALGLTTTAAAAEPRARFVDASGATVGSASIAGAPPPAGAGLQLESCGRSSGSVTLVSRDVEGREIDKRLVTLREGKGECARSDAFDLAMDADDRDDPSRPRLALVVRAGGTVSAAGAVLRVVGSAPDLPVSRLELRVSLVRARPGGPPPFGADDAKAKAAIGAEIDRARGVLSQCGVVIADVVRVVDPPSTPLVAVGCEHGLSATGGGEVRLSGKGASVSVTTRPGEPATAVARRLRSALQAKGIGVELGENPRIGQGAGATVDLTLTRGGKRWAAEEAKSTDETLSVCLARVSLEDGLQHFGDLDAAAGTLEERALLRAVVDHDPTTLDVVVVPAFGTAGRIGESFIAGDRGAFPATVILDRAGVRAGSVSFALAHEIGHVLLDLPGHADDFGRDTPSRLMDSDAGDGTAHGPRRLDREECTRMTKTFGPGRPLPLLRTVPERVP